MTIRIIRSENGGPDSVKLGWAGQIILALFVTLTGAAILGTAAVARLSFETAVRLEQLKGTGDEIHAAQHDVVEGITRAVDRINDKLDRHEADHDMHRSSHR